MKLLSHFLAAILLMATTTSNAEQPYNQNQLVDTRVNDYETFIDANRLLMFATNTGSFGYDQGGLLGKLDGLYYPYYTVDDILDQSYDNSVIFGAGIWIAGVDPISGDTLVSVAEYSDDYFPGPMSGGTFIPTANTDPQYRVYKIYQDSASSNPNLDYLQWPSAQGAPLDGIGNPLLLADQTLWTVFNDANSSVHTNDASSATGLSVEIQHTLWAKLVDGTAPFHPEDVSIYSKYVLINKSSKTYEDFFISLWFDPDIGDAGDDLIGCDTILNIFYCYNGPGADNDYGDNPPAVGGKLIEGPIVPSQNDTATVNGIPVPGFRNLEMYSFMRYVNGTDPQNYQWTYQYMNGLDASNGGAPLANGTRYAVPGDPVLGTGDIDTDDRDVRMMASFGPLTFNPNDTQQIIFKIGVGQGENRLASITALKENLCFTPEVEAELVTYITPDPQSVVFNNPLEEFYDSVFVGWSDGGSVADIDGGSLLVNGLAPLSAMMLPSHPQHSGPVWRLLVDSKQFLSPYGWIYGTNIESYSVSGQFTDTSPLSVNGAFEYIGHKLGDINRNGKIDILDLNYMVNFIFRGGPVPDPVEAGDLNNDGAANMLDLNEYVNLIFRNGQVLAD